MNFKKISLELEHWTPATLFFALSPPQNSILLDSGRTHPKTARYSFLGIDPIAKLEAKNERCQYTHPAESCSWEGNPLTFLKQKIGEWGKGVADPTFPPFVGGAIGFLSYEALQWTEPIDQREKPHLNLPHLFFLFFDWVIAFDHFKNKIFIVGKDSAEPKMESARRKIQSLRKKEVSSLSNGMAHWESNFSKKEFINSVRRVKEYIRAGDIFQANLSQRLFTETNTEGEKLFLALNEVNPSPFSCYLKTPSFEIISSSPERLVRSHGTLAETRPIAGTRPCSANAGEDLCLELELQQNKKEKAEHIMLLDLERNDLGKVCNYGSVQVSEFLTVEKYSHVRHLVSNVQGRLSTSTQPIDLLQAMFPGGTITGTPKVRSMEIIDELETVKREIYTGSLGYFSYTGESDFNIMIRTFIKKERQLFLHAGAGIVADSDPEKEYEETLHKAQALTVALSRTEKREAPFTVDGLAKIG